MEGWAPRKRGGNRLVLALAAALCLLAALVAVAIADEANEVETFGRDGIATPSLGNHLEETWFSTLEARPDGGLLARREGPAHPPYVDYLESYLPNGAPDPSSPPQPVPTDHWPRVYPLADGKRLVADGFDLTRLNPDGSADASFGGTGAIRAPIEVQAAAELPSGDILLVGVSVTPPGLHWVTPTLDIAFVRTDGSIVRGTDGTLRVPLTSSPSNWRGPPIAQIALTGDGGALVVGAEFLFELRADGSPNSEFGSNGMVAGLPSLVGGRVLSDGSIEAVGSGPGAGAEDLLALRLTAAGAPDTSFGPDGLRRFDLGGTEDAGAALWAPDGSVLIGGYSVESGPCNEDKSCVEAPVVIALGPGGDLDRGFGDGGVVRLGSLAGASGGLTGRGVDALARRPDGSILAAGGAPPGQTVAFLAALSPRGELLAGFGEGGIVRVRQPVPATQTVAGFVLQPGGKLLAAATSDVGVGETPVLIRYAADGSVDRSFGNRDGYVTLSKAGSSSAVAENAKGQVLVAVYGYPRSHLVLRDPEGAPVPSFGAEGEIQLPRGTRVRAVAFVGGSPVVLGTRLRGGRSEQSMVMRFRPDGSLDTRFGRGGRVELRPGGRKLEAIAIGSGGRIFVAGLAGGRFTLGSLLGDGSLDRQFGVAGWAMPAAHGVPKGVALKRAGRRIYLASTASASGRSHIALLRYRADGELDDGFRHGGRIEASLPGPAIPRAIVPTRRGVLVALSAGSATPLLSFGRDGKVRRERLGGRADNVRAIRLKRRLVVGWSQFSQGRHQAVYHLAKRPLR